MNEEFILDYTGLEINEKLAMVDILNTQINNVGLLNMNWDTILIFDGGSSDIQVAVLDETILL